MSAVLSFEPDEPRGSGLPGGRGGDGWDEEEGARQGLYVTLPAGELTLEGFAAGGRADTMAPGPLLAVVLGAVAGEDGKGLAGLSDDRLTGFLSGTRRMESQLAWAKMAALAGFASRPRRPDFAAGEVASAFHLARLPAARGIGYACTVARRLPVTFAALGAGRLGPVHVKIIDEVTSILSEEDAAIAGEGLAGAAPSRTCGELRRAAAALVLERDSRLTAGEPSASDGSSGPAPEPAPGPAASQGPGIGAMIAITVPSTALGGDSGPPGEVAGSGILDHADTRDLVAAAARNPATRWCVTVLNPDGTAAAHGCAAGLRPQRRGLRPGPHRPTTRAAGPECNLAPLCKR
jgi:hypothetical protein